MAGYKFQEYPKWIGGFLVHDAAEEMALKDAAANRTATPEAEQPDRQRSAAAVRMQRSRARRRAGKRTIRFDISDTQIDALVVAGFLDRLPPAEADISQAIGLLLGSIASDACRATR